MDKERLEQLQNVFSIIKGSVTKEEFLASVKMLVAMLERRMKEDKAELSMGLAMVATKAKEVLDKTESGVAEKIAKIKEGRDGIDGRDGKDGEKGEKGERGDNGLDADVEAVKADIIEYLSKNLPMFGTQFRDGLETLQGDERLDSSAIKGLEDLVKKLIPAQRTGGGGVSAIGVRQAFKHIAHTEQPTGAIDGANTTYRVKNDIYWIAGFVLNGEQIAELPNFTYAGKTITFASALPAAYSGKDFEVKYLG